VPLRAEWELYYVPFAAAITAGVGTLMPSYNRINGTWSSENAVTLGDLYDPNGMGFLGCGERGVGVLGLAVRQ